MRRLSITGLIVRSALVAAAAGACDRTALLDPPPGGGGAIRINEIVASNDGAWIDERGEADDFIEIVNVGHATQSLAGFALSDRPDQAHPLPDVALAPGARLLLWADADPEQGPHHLDFKLSSAGETVFLWQPDGQLSDQVSFPAARDNDSFARFPDGTGPLVTCRWATPGADNGAACQGRKTGGLPPAETFAPYAWARPWPRAAAPLALSELALRPAAFIEIVNTSKKAVDLAAYVVGIGAHGPGRPLPTESDGTTVAAGTGKLGAGQRTVVAIDEAHVAGIAADANFEGVVTLWRRDDATAVDRVDFMAWPDGAVLALPVAGGQGGSDSGGEGGGEGGPRRFCATATPGLPNDPCDPLPDRVVGDRLRHMYTPGDFAALARGGTAVGQAAVKVVVDMQAGDTTHFLSSAAWDLHFRFVRQKIEGQEPLDRCDPAQADLFNAGWWAFTQTEYFSLDRRFLLPTVIHHAGSDLHTLEYSTGDVISPELMARGFFAVVAGMQDPTVWTLRPETASQSDRARDVEGELPIVDGNAPFRDVSVQLLTTGVAYGVLTFVPADALPQAAVGPQTIVVTDDVPGDIPLVGGLITAAFQTPLSHVNVLSRNRGTPNLALRDGRMNPRVAPFLEALVRFEVAPGGFEIRTASPAEAQAFWDEHAPDGPPVAARLDTGVRGLQRLANHGIASLPTVGAKAAQLAEIGRTSSVYAGCEGPITVPRDAAAIPLAHFLDHLANSGAAALLASFAADADFRANPVVRAGKLAVVRQAIMSHPVDPALVAEVEAYLAAHFGDARVRFRSSSNAEDLPGFGGAGLYTSVSAALDDPDRRVDDAIRTVWASLYNARAYDERQIHNLDESSVAMGILIHAAFRSEQANGVAVTRNVLNPIHSDQYTLNAQRGEASVVNPAPGITVEQSTYFWRDMPPIVYATHSNLPDAIPVMTLPEVQALACRLRAIHDRFRPLLDPEFANPWFAIDAEFKLAGDGREIVIKQARPYSFGNAAVPTDCREY